MLVSEGRTRVVPIVAEQSRIDGGFGRRIKPLTPRRQVFGDGSLQCALCRAPANNADCHEKSQGVSRIWGNDMDSCYEVLTYLVNPFCLFEV